ncbi:hypothetical protein ACFLR4_04500 [Bacteroidota bacterium]
MKHIPAVLIMSFLFVIQINAQLDRFSSNPIPKLNAFAIALSEDIDAANTVVNEMYKGMIGVPIDFEVYVDPTYKKLKEQGGFDVSLFGESATGKKYKSVVDTEFDLKANNFSLLVIDRQKRVRAFARVSTVDPEVFGRVIEELLLNIDGEEKISVDSEKEEGALGLQTDLGKYNEEKENEDSIVIDFGASEKKWYEFLGEEIPDVGIAKMDGTDVKFHDLIDGKVTLVLVFMASKSQDAMMKAAGIAMQIGIMNEIYKSFTLGEADPGDEWVENAFGDGSEPMKKPD